MKTRSKAILLISGAAVLAGTTVFGTLAFLTAQETAVNTFTVGKVEIDLKETDVDGDGDVLVNEYRLVPGTEYVKDPQMTVLKGSESAYVRMLLTVHNADTVETIIDEDETLTDFTGFLGGMSENWILSGTTEDETANTITYEYRYYDADADSAVVTGSAAEDTELPALFETLIIPSTLDGDDLEELVSGGFKMVVEGHAIQAQGFENADMAWTAFDKQIGE
ncbi:MAG: hypothetical protein IJ496_04340 [Ruminococcus sp.]|nr:hypothetical protein [Ruminococcus sp.]